MASSEKKARANRLNAQKSTGPKSVPGKAKVAMNAVKHGLRAAHLVLPGEEADAFDAMLASWMGDWKPPTDARRVLVEQAVAHAWRLRRCLKAERDHLLGARPRPGPRPPPRRRRAGPAGRRRPGPDDPAAALRTLLADRAGAEAVRGLWRDLAGVVADGADSWKDAHEHHGRLLNLLGIDAQEVDPESLEGAADSSRWLVEWNEMRRPIRPFQLPPADPEGEAEARDRADELSAFLAGQVAEVESYLATRFPPARAEAEAEAELALAAASAALDDSDEGRALLATRAITAASSADAQPAHQAHPDGRRPRRGRPEAEAEWIVTNY